MPSSARFALLAIAIAVALTACGGDNPDTGSAVTETVESPVGATAPDNTIDPVGVFDPVVAGEELPDGFRQLLSRDRILPVYKPEFVAAGLIDWRDDSLVIGVDIDSEARAYPVAFLTRREMVIDNHRGIPTLVTW